MKKKIISALLASVLCVSMVLPTVASSVDQQAGVHTYKTGTEVYAGVTLDNEDPDIGGDPKIRVTVPTTFAFVVNGTTKGPTSTEGKAGLSVKDGTILVPNYTIDVDESQGGPNHPYSLDVTGDGKMQFNNYSTRAALSPLAYNAINAKLSPDDMQKFYPYDKQSATGRVGIEVSMTGYIENEGTALSRNYWEHVAEIQAEPAAKNAGKNQFKKYTLAVNEIGFDNKVVEKNPLSNINVDRFYMSKKIPLSAPRADLPGSCDDTSNDFAKSPATHDINFSVDVGGVRSDYVQIEKSAKVGTIVWTASYIYNNDGSDGKTVLPTAPDHLYQHEAGTGGELPTPPTP